MVKKNISPWVALPRRSSKTSLKRKLRWEEEGDEEQLQSFDAPSALGGPPTSSPAPVTVKAECSTNGNNEPKQSKHEGGWHQIYIPSFGVYACQAINLNW